MSFSRVFICIISFCVSVNSDYFTHCSIVCSPKTRKIRLPKICVVCIGVQRLHKPERVFCAFTGNIRQILCLFIHKILKGTALRAFGYIFKYPYFHQNYYKQHS